LYENCVFLASRQENKSTRVSLYSAGHFYVEVWCDTGTFQLGRIRSFNVTQLLDPYLQAIQLPSCLQHQ
jgi:hypothetical protein